MGAWDEKTKVEEQGDNGMVKSRLEKECHFGISHGLSPG